ncbi:glycosyltransferase family 4 protein [Photobacterium phosphoreum]|uniref:glycosyltransferase n=1 Tax=Photobacterium phosphoreum TaxID=659 RepID=UPI000D167F3D|nr:glycosyltransferase [Photobacterium phosphoreum]PSW34962.1 glycosyltransferase family 4 protein [Photobacterium phosphoreum]
MIKIDLLLLNAFDFGGIERASNTLFQAFKSFDINCELISVREKKNKKSFEYIEDPTVLQYGKTDFMKLFFYAKNIDKNVVVISTYDRISIMLSLCFFLLKKKNKIIAHQHADYYAHSKKIRCLRFLFYRRIDFICALTQQDVKYYLEWHENVYLIPNILQLSHEYKYIPIKERDTDLIAIGRLDPVKRFDDYIKISSLLIEEDIISSSILIGDGPEFNKLKKLDRHNIIKGRNDNIYTLLQNAKILLVTSYRESFSMVILEAMSQGTIVISYNCPTGPGELIQDGVNGFLVENGNVNAMLDKCRFIFENIDKFDDISKAAILTSKLYSSQIIIDKWKNLIYEC